MQQNKLNTKPKRSVKFRLIFILLFLVLSLIAAYSYNFCFPIQYKSLAKISLISDKKSEVASFVNDLKKISSQKEFQNKVLKSLNDKEDYSEIYNSINLFEAKNGVAHIEFNGKNADKLDKYITNYIKNVENYFYSKAQKTNKSTTPHIDEKQIIISQIKNDIKNLKEKLEALPEPKIIKVIEHKSQAELSFSKEKSDLSAYIVKISKKLKKEEEELNSTSETLIITEMSLPTSEYKTIEQQIQYEQKKLSELYRTYKDKHPKIISCKKNIDNLKRLLAAASSKKIQKSAPNPKYHNLLEIIENDKITLQTLQNELRELTAKENENKSIEPQTTEKEIIENEEYTTERNKLKSQIQNLVDKQINFEKELAILENQVQLKTYHLHSITQNPDQFTIVGLDPKIPYIIATAISLILAFILLIPILFSNETQYEEKTNTKATEEEIQNIIAKMKKKKSESDEEITSTQQNPNQNNNIIQDTGNKEKENKDSTEKSSNETDIITNKNENQIEITVIETTEIKENIENKHLQIDNADKSAKQTEIKTIEEIQPKEKENEIESDKNEKINETIKNDSLINENIIKADENEKINETIKNESQTNENINKPVKADSQKLESNDTSLNQLKNKIKLEKLNLLTNVKTTNNKDNITQSNAENNKDNKTDKNSNSIIKDILNISPIIEEKFEQSINNFLNSHNKILEKASTQLQILMSKNKSRVIIPITIHTQTQKEKSNWIINIASALSNSGYNILIIDSNYFNPNIHESLNATNDLGISDILDGKALTEAIQPTNIKDINILSLGKISRSSIDDIYIQNLELIIKKARRLADIIIINTPSIEQDNLISKLRDDKVSFLYLNDKNDSEEEINNIKEIFKTKPFTGYFNV